MKTESAYIPIDSAESAVLTDSHTLLPKKIYEQLARLIRFAVENIPNQPKALNDSRSHNAISIDGDRGTGKTSVLVNLKNYLCQDSGNTEDSHQKLLQDIHILDPIDPTLLEDGESLFLHVIVAAVLNDETVKLKQRHYPEQARALNQSLEKLAQGLASVEGQKHMHGMDKIRAMYGNRHLADCVQSFFCSALTLLAKKLLVLPIDDVDTSLSRAFENLEIIRRYLTTPYVLPIVSGDRSLYTEVTWRDFHGRLIEDSTYRSEEAYQISLHLANEYQRKILPLPRRLTMPDVSEYWQNPGVKLRGKTVDILSLQNFYAWLTIFISGPVNGLEGSRLNIPLPSIRALIQLVNHCSKLIPSLPAAVREADSVLQVQRTWQMPYTPQNAIEKFHSTYQELSSEKKREYAGAYKAFSEVFKKKEDGIFKGAESWVERLIEYFHFEPQAGSVYLVLRARQDWRIFREYKSGKQWLGVFDTPLFQPLMHGESEFDIFLKPDDLSDWSIQLAKRLPERWLEHVKKSKTILPYPIAEVGINSAINWKYAEEIKIKLISISDDTIEDLSDIEGKSIFLISLLTQYNFYTQAKQSMMLNIGRVFELIISSLLGPVRALDIQRIQQRAPFFSTSALAPTKVILSSGINYDNSDSLNSGDAAESSATSHLDVDVLNSLTEEIAQWREKHVLDEIDFSPWLIYKVFNKVYSQISNFEQVPNGMKSTEKALDMVGVIFYATWSAFGSFEKGEIFGLPDVVATVNLNSPRNFEKNDHYKMNVQPFSPGGDRDVFASQTRTVSYFLADHPLRNWIDAVLKVNFSNEDEKDGKIKSINKLDAREWLQNRINSPGMLTERRVLNSLNKIPAQECSEILREMKNLYPKSTQLQVLERAVNQRLESQN